MCCFFPNHLNWWFAEARRATIGFLEKACTRLSASIFYCKESDTVSNIDRNCVVASFSLGKKKSSRNFGCRAIRRTDKSCCCRRWSVCSRCLGEFLPCVLQLLLKADLKLVRLQRSWSQPVGLSPETTLAMELYAQNLTFSDKNNQKRTKVSSMSSLTEISVLGNTFPSIVCLSFDRSSGFSFHLICSCKSRVGNSDWRRVMSELLKKHPSWRNVAVSIALRIIKGFDTCSSLKWHL